MEAIKGKMEFSLPGHNVLISGAMANMHTTLKKQDEAILHLTRRAIERAGEGKTSSWLTALPLAHHPFDLSATEFCDALVLQYITEDASQL